MPTGGRLHISFLFVLPNLFLVVSYPDTDRICAGCLSVQKSCDQNLTCTVPTRNYLKERMTWTGRSLCQDASIHVYIVESTSHTWFYFFISNYCSRWVQDINSSYSSNQLLYVRNYKVSAFEKIYMSHTFTAQMVLFLNSSHNIISYSIHITEDGAFYTVADTEGFIL